MRKAVVDVGSNSIILTVCERNGQILVPIHEATSVTGLGRGTKSTQKLSEQAIVHSLEVLAQFFSLAKNHGCDKVEARATMAVRMARNQQEFIDRCSAQNTPVSVISGDEEARLGRESVFCDPSFSDSSRISVIDVGGHSTEISVSSLSKGVWETLLSQSFPVGALGLREGTLEPDIVSPSELLAATLVCDDIFSQRLLPHQSGVAVSLGATGTNLVSIREKMNLWQPAAVHGQILDYEEVSKAASWLGSLGDVGRSKVVGLERGREHTLHAGALILERCLFMLGANNCHVSTNGWRHGLIHQLFSE